MFDCDRIAIHHCLQGTWLHLPDAVQQFRINATTVAISSAKMECTLGRVGQCRAAGENFQLSVTEARFDSIRSASKRRGYRLHQELESHFSIKIHRKCASLYTSKTLVDRVEKRHRDEKLTEARHAKQLRSNAPVYDSGIKFDFKIHCLFCINPATCTLPCEYDAKVPRSRRQPASLVRTDVDKHGREFTKVSCAKCCERNDRLGHVVKTRIESMLESDLHAADSRYHRACKTNFLYNFKVNSNESEDPSVLALADTMSANRAKMWNSAELQQEYEESGGSIITRRKILIQKVKQYFKDAIIVLCSQGISSIVAFASETTKLFHLLKQDEDEDDIDAAVSKVAKKIQQETSTLKKKRNTYIDNIDVDIAREPISETLLSLLEKVSGKFSDSLTGLLIGNMISGMVHKSIIGVPQADINEVCSSASAFLIACFGKTYADCKSMSECRLKMWKKKIGAGASIKLSRLPPTTEAANEHIKRAHYQVAHWMTAMSGMPPPLSPKDHGWEQDGFVLKPCAVTPGTKLAHDEILQMVRCGCEQSACKGAICKCSLIGCTVFFACEAGPLCLNPLTKRSEISDHDEAECNDEGDDDDEDGQ